MRKSLTHSISLKSSQHTTPKLSKNSSIKFYSLASSLTIQNNFNQAATPQFKAKNKQQLSRIEMFVEQVAADPTLLGRLVDYQQLIENLKEEHLRLQQYIQQCKKQRQNIQMNIKHISGADQESIASLLKKQESNITFEINQYIQLQQQLKQKIKNNIQQRIAKQLLIKQKIKTDKENNNLALKKIQNQNNRLIEEKKEKQIKIKQINQKTTKLKNKIIENDVKKKQLKKMAEIVRDKKIQMSDLKRKQTEELKKYRQQMMKKKSNEIELKKSSEKKLNKFIIELSKIVESGDKQSFNVLIQSYESRKPENREKNITADTTPEQSSQNNEDDQQNEHELEDMEAKNPVLKQNKSMNIKSLTDVVKLNIKNSHTQRDIEQYQIRQKQQVQKIKQLGAEEQDLNVFLDTLQQKLNKLNIQLSSTKINNTLK